MKSAFYMTCICLSTYRFHKGSRISAKKKPRLQISVVGVGVLDLETQRKLLAESCFLQTPASTENSSIRDPQTFTKHLMRIPFDQESVNRAFQTVVRDS